VTASLWAQRLPCAWPLARIKDHVDLVNGFPFDSAGFNDSVGTPLIRIRDLLRGRTDTHFDGFVPPSALIYDGDLVVGMDGDFNSVVWRGGRAALNQRLCVLRPRASLEPRFLSYCIPMPLSAINNVTYFTTVKHLSSFDLLDELVPLPPLPSQRAIADYLDAETARIDALIAKKRRMMEVLGERFASWRERVMVLREDVTWTPLHHLTDQHRPIVYGIVQAGEEVPDGVPYIKTGDVADLRPDRLSRTSPEIDEAYRRARVHPGDIVIAMRASIGLSVMIPEELPTANLTQGTARIAARPGVDAEWLIHALRSRAVQEQCEVRAVGTTFKTLNIWDLRRVRIPAVSSDGQRSIADVISRAAEVVASLIASLTHQIDLLIEHRQALITAAVTGQLEIPGMAT
jgi:type I restriction enzyme, S subunit